MLDLQETVTVFSGEHKGKTGIIIAKKYPRRGSGKPPSIILRLDTKEIIEVDIRDM